MRRWPKTVFHWDLRYCGTYGIDTNVPVTDWPRSGEKHFHSIRNISAASLLDRKGRIEVMVDRVMVPPTTERKTILDKLAKGLKGSKSLFDHDRCAYLEVKNDDQDARFYSVEFTLKNGEQFCDMVIRIVRRIFEILGVRDESGYRLADFELSQEMFIEFEGSWLPFAQWLRIEHRLPVM